MGLLERDEYEANDCVSRVAGNLQRLLCIESDLNGQEIHIQR